MIYFIRDESTDRIKIGTTIRLSQRLYQLGLVTTGPLLVLAVIPGSYADEHVLHERFKFLRIVGEWFKPDDELIDFIATEGQPWDGQDEAPDIASTKIDAEVLANARIAAAYKGMSLAEYLSETLRPIVMRDMELGHAKKMNSQGPPKGKGAK